MAFPYTVIGPGGQPFIIGQVPVIQQAVMPPLQPQAVQQQAQQVQVVQHPKIPDYMSEEKLQEKGQYKLLK